MKGIPSWLGPVVFGLLLINLLRLYVSQSEWARQEIPRALLDAAGKAHRDGKPADAVAMAERGREKEAWVTFAAIVVWLPIWGVMEYRGARQDAVKMEATQQEIRQMFGLPNEDTL